MVFATIICAARSMHPQPTSVVMFVPGKAGNECRYDIHMRDRMSTKHEAKCAAFPCTTGIDSGLRHRSIPRPVVDVSRDALIMMEAVCSGEVAVDWVCVLTCPLTSCMSSVGGTTMTTEYSARIKLNPRI